MSRQPKLLLSTLSTLAVLLFATLAAFGQAGGFDFSPMANVSDLHLDTPILPGATLIHAELPPGTTLDQLTLQIFDNSRQLPEADLKAGASLHADGSLEIRLDAPDLRKGMSLQLSVADRTSNRVFVQSAPPFDLRELTSKDWLTIAISVFAAALSILSFAQKRSENKNALRKQVTEGLEKLSALNTENSKFLATPLIEGRREGYPDNYPGLINDQRRFLTYQLSHQFARIPADVLPYEHLLLAGAYDSLDRFEQADIHFNIACADRNIRDRGIALRGYGRYLFSVRRQEEARTKILASLECFRGDTDRERLRAGDTYERWAAQEEEWGEPSVVSGLLASALEIYTGLESTKRRGLEINKLRARIDRWDATQLHSIPTDAPSVLRSTTTIPDGPS